MQQVEEAPVAADRIIERIDTQPDQLAVVADVSLFQPFENTVTVAQGAVDKRHVHRGNIRTFAGFELRYDLFRVSALAASSLREREQGADLAVSIGENERLLQFGHSFGA